MSGTPKGNFRIVDREGLKAIAKDVVTRIAGGDVALAAEKIGLHPKTLKRLCTGDHPQVRKATLHAFADGALQALTPIEGFDRAARVHNAIGTSVTTFEATEITHHADAWAWWYLWDFALGGGQRFEVTGGVRQPVADRLTRGWRRRADAVEALAAAWDACPDVLAGFAHYLEDHVSETRELVAYLRLVEPLLHCAESAFVERHWTELTPREWKDFLKAGVAREKVAIGSANLAARAIAVADARHVAREETSPDAKARRSSRDDRQAFGRFHRSLTGRVTQLREAARERTAAKRRDGTK